MRIKNFLVLALVVSCSSAVAVVPYYSIRSQAVNAARDLAGTNWVNSLNCCNTECDCGALFIAAEYTRSFRPYDIGRSLFGCCGDCDYPCETGCSSTGCCETNCCNKNNKTTINISGSQVTDRGQCDWLADYFGLPLDFESCVQFTPRVENVIVDFQFYSGINCCKGLYFRFDLPVVYTRWNLNMCETIKETGTADAPAGYYSSSTIGTDYPPGIHRNSLVSDFTSFASGCGVINDENLTFDPLCYARMTTYARSEARFAEIAAVVGWNFWCEDCSHFGFNVRAAAPAGNRPDARYLFEPIVGNGKHWEVGAGMSSHYTWQTECNNQCWGVYLDANFTHLFSTKQCRTFDLRCKPMSRYMLAAKMGTPVENLNAGSGGPVPVAQYKDVLTPVANLTTFAVDVDSDIQADIAIKVQHTRCKWGFDLGYNFWTRSCENIRFRCDCGCPFEENTWVLKGDAFVYGYTSAPTGANPTALSASQSKATICSGTNTPNATSDAWYANVSVDFPETAYRGDSALATAYNRSYHAVYTSYNPVFLSLCDIDCENARTRGLSHKIFGSVDYACDEYNCNCTSITGFLGIGFEAEFGHNSCDDGCAQCCYPCGIANSLNSCTSCDRCCNDECCCQYIALSQWGIWIKGGIAF